MTDRAIRHDPVVVAGASGFVGSRLCKRLLEEGVEVRCGSRDPDGCRARWPGCTWVQLDTGDPYTLASALEGARTLVYLVHHLGQVGDLEREERRAAERIVRAAEQAGVDRIVYLGGPAPSGQGSAHLRSRLETGEILRSGKVPTIELRASLIIGAGGQSWRIARDLALRLPIMVLPRWLDRKIQPIAVDDVVEALARAISLHDRTAGWWDLPGPETVSVRQLLRRVADADERTPIMVPVPLLTPRLSTQWIRWFTRADHATARQLVEGLTGDLVSADAGFWTHIHTHPQVDLDRAIQRALREDGPGPSRAAEVWERVTHGVSHLPWQASRVLGS